jgi:PAS domain S-box-containing protein
MKREELSGFGRRNQGSCAGKIWSRFDRGLPEVELGGGFWIELIVRDRLKGLRRAVLFWLSSVTGGAVRRATATQFSMEPHHQESTKNAGMRTAEAGNVLRPLQRNAKHARTDYPVGKMAGRIVLVYVIVAALWILISDPVLAALVGDHDLLMKLEVVKGWVFVAVTAALLFALMRREIWHWTDERAAREKAEVVMRESELRFRQLFDLAPLPISYSKRDGAATNFNGRFRQVFGYTPEDIPTLNEWWLLAYPDASYRRQVMARWENAVKRAEIERTDIEPTEVRITKKNGETGNFLVSGSLLSNDVLAVFVDISERIRDENTLRESEARYRLLAEHTADVIWVFNATTQRYTYVSPSVERLRGFTANEVRGQAMEQSLTPSSYATFQNILPGRLEAFHAGDEAAVTQMHELEQPRKDGSTVWTEVSTTLIKSASGEIQLLGVSRDISERRRMQERLRRQEILLRETTELAHIGGWEFDPATMEGTWTEETARIHDLDPTEKTSAAKGLSFYAGASRAKIEAAVHEAMAHGTPYDLELELTTATGRNKWVRAIAHPVIENGKVVRIRGTFQDVSERRRAEAFSEGKKHLLEMVANGAPLQQTLVALTRLVEAQYPGAQCSVMLLDNDGIHLRDTASPSLPATFMSKCDGEAIGPSASPCGAAAFRQEPVYVENIETGPVQKDYQAVALAHGLRACWATPIFGDGRVVFGTFVAYFKHPCKPDAQQLHLIELVTHTAAIAINRHRSESALQESEERSRAVVEAAPEAIYIHTGDCFTYLNPMAVRLFGAMDDKQLIGRPVIEQFHPECRQAVRERMRQLNDMRLQVPPAVDKILRCDGTTIEVEISAVPFVYRQEKGALVFARDITDRKKAGEALRESEERFRQVVENMDEVFWMTEPSKNKMLYVSPAYQKIWQRDSDSLYASLESWNEAIHPEDRQRVVEAAINKRATGEYAETYRILRPDGEVRWIHDRAFPIRDESGRVYRVVGTATDITERRTLEEQFRQAQKMEAIGTLAGGIAHDFNNILGAIVGFAELAKMDAPAPPVQGSLDEILRACKRAGDLVRQILAFSRRQEQKRRSVQLSSVIDEATKLLRAALPSTIQFEIELATDAPAVLADPTQIHQVVMNLCTNAAHAMKGRPGRLGVKLERFEADEEFVKLHQGSRPGGYARLTVSDNGHGMDQTTLDRIYEPFFTTKAPGEGTGLGLSVVHGIVQNHDGIITVYSRPGEGTIFRLYFPAHISDVTEQTLQSGSIPRGHGQRILVVDDETLLVEMTERILNRLGYVAETATDPGAALETIRAEPARYDLILTDLTMPGMTGVEFTAGALKVSPRIPIILMTGFFANMTPSQVRANGIKEVLMKPITIRSLGETVDRVLR